MLNDETEVPRKMNATARIASVLSGAALGLALVATAPAAHADAPARAEAAVFDCDGPSASVQATAKKTPDQTPDDHPSGKEGKGVDEPGGSGTQGRSDSDPDGDANGGADKPGCDGGFDDDRDGNNGCGNDADFEDDNNGNCGGLRGENVPDVDDTDVEAGVAGTVNAATITAAGIVTTAPGTQVAGETAVATEPGATVAGTATAADPTATSGAPGTQVLGLTLEQPGTLARTGAGLAGLMMAAGACLGGGRLAGVARRLLGG